MTSTLIIGESMVELTHHTDDLLRKSFAGDTHSAAVYLKRLAGDSEDVSLLSAVGLDGLSNELIEALNKEGVSTHTVLQHPTRTIGLYMVHTDSQGERSFQYWRSQSAARATMALLEQQPALVADLAPTRVFFSGITLAIFDSTARAQLRELLEQLKMRGTQVIFDPNYRPALWQNEEETKAEYQWAFAVSDVVLPGLDDLNKLYGTSSMQSAVALVKTLCCGEAVIKNGEYGVTYLNADTQFSVEVAPVAKPVDTTAAGDSFNAALMAARSKGLPPKQAIDFAASVAAIVIQHKGAIIPRAELQHAISQLNT